MCRFFRIFIDIKQADMLPQEQTLQFSDYSDLYELIIPKDNLLRRINDLVDFSFILDELMVSIRNKPLGLIEKNLTRVIREIFCSSMVAVA